MTQRILIVEDEPELADVVADYVRAAGFAAETVHDGELAWQSILASMPDLLVLDLMLPGIDGLTLCRRVRERSAVPIVMVTARVEEIDRLLGLESGADDYVCKPFSPRELVARIRAILRRAGMQALPRRRCTVDEAGRRILVDGHPLDLTPAEFNLLAAMVRRPGQVFSRAQLLDLANPDKLDVGDRAIDTHIKNLRRKLAKAVPDAEPIESVYGLGYRFDLE